MILSLLCYLCHMTVTCLISHFPDATPTAIPRQTVSSVLTPTMPAVWYLTATRYQHLNQLLPELSHRACQPHQHLSLYQHQSPDLSLVLVLCLVALLLDLMVNYFFIFCKRSFELGSRKPGFGFITRCDTNQAVQPQTIDRGLKFWI